MARAASRDIYGAVGVGGWSSREGNICGKLRALSVDTGMEKVLWGVGLGPEDPWIPERLGGDNEDCWESGVKPSR